MGIFLKTVRVSPALAAVPAARNLASKSQPIVSAVNEFLYLVSQERMAFALRYRVIEK